MSLSFVLNISTLRASDGGPPRAVVAIATELSLRGHSVDVVYLAKAGDALVEGMSDAKQAGVRFQPVGVKRLGRFRFSPRQLATAARISRNADVVTAHGFYQWTCIAAWLASRLNRCEFWIQPHGVFEAYQQRVNWRIKQVFMHTLGNRILDSATAIWVATDAEKVGAGEVAALDKINVQPLGVRSVQLGQRSDSSLCTPTVLFMSRVAPKKRLDLLLNAMHEVRTTLPEARLIVCGTGDTNYVEGLKRDESGGLTEWRGHVAGECRLAAYADADIFVLPSENENFGQAVTDAMAAGLPVVTTVQTASSKLVEAAGAGLVLDSPTVEELSAGMLEMLLDLGRWRAHGARGAEFVARELTWSGVAERWEDLATSHKARRG